MRSKTTRRLIWYARDRGFTGHTTEGARRYLLKHYLPRVKPVWQWALDARYRASQQDRATWHRERWLKRLNKRYVQEFAWRLREHAAKIKLRVTRIGIVRVSDAPEVEQLPPARRAKNASLKLVFDYRKVGNPIVATVIDGALIMDAELEDELWRVKYARNAARADVVMADGYVHNGALFRTPDRAKAAHQAMLRALDDTTKEAT